jgi:hypothetical protein
MEPFLCGDAGVVHFYHYVMFLYVYNNRDVNFQSYYRTHHYYVRSRMVLTEQIPSRSLYLFVRYVSLFLVTTWLVVTYVLYVRYDRSRILNVRVDFANTNACAWPLQQAYPTGSIELLVQGSNLIQRDVDYSLFIHVTFLDSWTTVMSGVITFLSDFGHGRQTIASILPITRPPFSWVATRVLLFPFFASGLYRDTVEHDILVSTSFRLGQRLLGVPVHPVYTDHIEYVARVQIIPAVSGHMPDIVSISAWFQASSMPETWSGTCLSYGLLLWYICMTLSTVISLSTCTTLVIMRCAYPVKS